jgi:NhaP-type Na+/H+ or K+/H+ antiporter
MIQPNDNSFLLIYAGTMLLALMISSFIARSMLSASVLFLASGFLFGEMGLGILRVNAQTPAVAVVADLALFSVLFTDGMRLAARELVSAWRLAGRALLLGLPLVLLGTAAAAWGIAGVSWLAALLIGAALSPTDPVFAAAIVGREEVPGRLRRLLNVESGVNDGIALPLVLGLLMYMGEEPRGVAQLLGEVAGGAALGVLVPLAALGVAKLRVFKIAPDYLPLHAFAVGLLVLGLAWQTHLNEYLAAFAAGVTMSTRDPDAKRAFRKFGSLVAELLKVAALLLFGALISIPMLKAISAWGYFFAAVALLAVRPVALNLALLGSALDWRERLVASWFGPKGFASVIYGLIILHQDVGEGAQIFRLIALVVVGSIVLHSSTDTLTADWFREEEGPGPPPTEEEEEEAQPADQPPPEAVREESREEKN